MSLDKEDEMDCTICFRYESTSGCLGGRLNARITRLNPASVMTTSPRVFSRADVKLFGTDRVNAFETCLLVACMVRRVRKEDVLSQ